MFRMSLLWWKHVCVGDKYLSCVELLGKEPECCSKEVNPMTTYLLGPDHIARHVQSMLEFDTGSILTAISW